MSGFCRSWMMSIFVFFLFLSGAWAQTPRFAVISDPHFYDTELGTTGAAFESYLAQDRKMLRESEAILESAIEDIKTQQPDFVLISGDLTKDGEKSSHLKLASHLADLESAGIEVYVVPGNHDINNPHAVAFEGENMVPVDYVTADEFAGIYDAFGYAQAIDRAPDSLSYVAEPTKGVWLFGIDSCQYDDNIANGHPQTGGAISDATLNWLLDKLFEARIRNKTVVGFMHHGIVEHFSGQSQLYADYLVDDWASVSETLSHAGLGLIFSGHFHANDITRSGDADHPLYDVETGSLVTYPSPFRMVDLHADNAAVVRSFFVESIDYDTAGQPFPEYARNFLLEGLTGLAGYMLTLPPDQGGFALTPAEAAAAAPLVATAFLAHYSGDESPNEAPWGEIQSYMTSPDPRYQGLGQALATLWTDLPPADGSALLSLRPQLQLSRLGTYATGIFDEGAAEISAHDPKSQTLFVVNGNDKTIDMLDISDPENPVALAPIDITPYGRAPNSVAVFNGWVAVAVEAQNKQDPGKVVLFSTTGRFLKAFTVGALPDMVTFTPDGRYLLVANEGEPNDDYTVDPEGSVSVIHLSRGLRRARVKTAHFRAFNRKAAMLKKQGVRIFGPGATVAQDLEPEYIAVLPHSPFAWVGLQENNAMAKIHLRTGRVVAIHALGFKKHDQPGQGFDPSDKDDVIQISPYAHVLGMYQPDAIAAYRAGGHTYIVTANEGDGRDYDTFSDEARVADLELDPLAFPNAEQLQKKALLGRLKVTDTRGDVDGDGDFDRLYAFGARSFSIFKVTRRGLVQVFDSGDQFEQITAAALPYGFNSDNDENDSADSRSDAKGPEPEGLVLGRIGWRTYAFIGLERIGGIMVYDISRPRSPHFVQYINNRDFAGSAEDGTAGDLGPEGIVFIKGKNSPNGEPMLAVTNEVSGTTTIYRIEAQHAPWPQIGHGWRRDINRFSGHWK